MTFTYAEIEYVSVRTYLSENRIGLRTLRILEPWKQQAIAMYIKIEQVFVIKY